MDQLRLISQKDLKLLMGLKPLMDQMGHLVLMGLMDQLDLDVLLNKYRHLQLNIPSLLGHLEYLNILDSENL
jgi:hypothetical protein